MSTARALCNFCCSNTRYEPTPTPQEQDVEAVSMESDVKSLRLLTRRITGRDLDGLTFPDLRLLRSRLSLAHQTVKTLKAQVEQGEAERMRNQKEQAAYKEVGTRSWSLLPCSSSRISSDKVPLKPDDEAPKPVGAAELAYQRRLAEPVKIEFDRLWLPNERFNGRKLQGMTFFELGRLECQILDSMTMIMKQMLEPVSEEEARRLKEESISVLTEQESCSLDNVMVADHRLRFTPQRRTRLCVSTKIRRVQRRKSMIKLVSRV